MPTYLETIHSLVAAGCGRHASLLQFGENIAQGSRICGLARNLPGPLLTVGNCENTHVGVGLGMMLEGAQALLVVKQLDFLLLAADQMVNTMNLVRASRDQASLGSFTILAIVCDQGWQGPQSSFHDLAGLCALARVNGYYLNGAGDARRVLDRHLVAPGFRIIGVSQRRFGEECLELPVIYSGAGEGELQYAEGAEATIAAFGFALPQALDLSARLRAAGFQPAIFQVNPVVPHNWTRVIASAVRTRRLIVLDDGKGAVSLGHKLAAAVLRVAPECHVTVETREQECEFAVNEDVFAPAVAV